MKTLKTFFTILLATISLGSCSSDDNKSNSIKNTEENPLDAYLEASGFNQTNIEFKNSDNFELGFSFKPKVAGKIETFIVKIPDVNPTLRVTLWDAVTRTPIKSETINVTAANVTIEKNITPIALLKDKEYLITFNSSDFFTRKKADGTIVTYPITAGNITITGCTYIPSTSTEEPKFPTSLNYASYVGDVTFKFQQTE